MWVVGGGVQTEGLGRGWRTLGLEETLNLGRLAIDHEEYRVLL